MKYVIVFDLHGVIVRRNYRGMLYHIFKNAYRLNLLLIFIKPSFIKDVVKLLYKSRVPEEFIIELSHKHRALLPLNKVVIAMMNEQQIIPTSFTLIQQLKKQGYKLYLFSNIGEKTFEALEKKFPLLFDYFDGILAVEHHDNWIQKPDRQAFSKFLSRFSLQPHNCIFIDNSHKNIATARLAGFYAILYKNYQKLYEELVRIGII